jgi:hypothetical protein
MLPHIVSGIALAALRRIGYSKNSVRMLGLLWAQLEHHVANGFGVSAASYKSTKDKLLYGIGQGSCSSPIVWALLNQLLLMALGEEFDCISLVSVDGRTTDTHPGESFVDDTTTGSTDDNHNLDPISSTVREIKEEEDSLVARMEEIIQFFLDVLQVTGGNLVPKKCAWYLIGHRWNKGVSKLIQIEPQHRSITMTSRSSGQVSGIKRKSPTEGHRTLGFFMTGDGTSNAHRRVMKKKDWLMRWRSETVLFNVDNVAWHTAHTTCLAGLDYLETIQNYSRLKYLIGHIRSKSITSKLIRQQLDYTQLEIGCSAQVLGQDYTRYSQAILCPNWITAIWESLHACKATVAIN